MLLLLSAAHAATLTVGPSGTYAAPCDAIAAAAAGDTIEVDAAGNYAGDTCGWSTEDLHVKGVNGQPVLDGTGASMAEQKGIFVIHAARATIENLAFKGASVPDQNGAGIRHQGQDLLVIGCHFEDNENGILGSPITDGTGTVEIRDSAFVHNGYGDGYSHNVYLGHYAQVIFRGSYSRTGNIGHLFKSRAARTDIVASRLTDESGGQASYEIDVPNGGDVWIVGTVVEQVGSTQNSGMISYGAEGPGSNTSHALHVINSTLVNHHDRGTFLQVGASVGATVDVINTVFVGPGTLSSEADTTFTATWDDSMGDANLTDPASLDLVPLASSPLVDAGVDPGVAVDLEFAVPLGTTARGIGGVAIDIGAFEYANPGGGDTGGGDDTGPADTDETGSTDTDTDDTGPWDTAGGDDTGEPAPVDEGACGCDTSGGVTGASLALALVIAAARRRR